ncbi:MAG: hypothetical protein AABZ55_13895 [Bdellovibrionota bacterium]
MSKKKGKFDLTNLVHDEVLKDGQKIFFVSDPSKFCIVKKMPNNEFKVTDGKETFTIHAFAQKCLGQEPPDHAAKWVRTEAGKILFDLWHAHDMDEAA